MNKIELKQVTKSFDNNVVLDNIDYSFYGGNFYIIKGRSGTGKSTLLSLIGQLDGPSSGEILYDGESISNINKYVDSNISYIFQDNNLFLDLTSLENLLLVTDDVELIKKTLEKFHILETLNQKAATLSKGEKNRLILSRIILEDKPILLLDEPIGNLDVKNAKLALSVLKEISKDHIVIMVMHNDIDIEEYDPVLLTIEDKKIVEHHTPSENIIIEKEKGPRKLSFKKTFKFVKTMFKNNPFRVLFFSLFQCVLFFLSFFSIGVLGSDMNPQIISDLNKVNVDAISIISNKPKDYLYRDNVFTFSYDNDDLSIECLYSKIDTFDIDNKHYNLKDNQLLISKSIVEESSLDLTKPIKLGEITLDVSTIDNKFSLLSNNVVSSLAKTNVYKFDSVEFDDFIEANISYDCASANIYVYNKNTIRSDFDFTLANSELKQNEINLIVPKYDFVNYENAYKNVINKVINITNTNNESKSLKDISSSFVVKGLIYDEKALFGSDCGIEISEELFNKFAEKYYELGYFSTIYNGYVLTQDNFKRYDFASNIASVANIISLDENDTNAITSFVVLQKILYYAFPIIIILNLITIYFISVGLSKSFEKEKNLLYSLSYQRKDIMKINLSFYLFLIGISILISVPAYLLSVSPLNNFYISSIEFPRAYSAITNSWFIIPYLVVFISLLCIFVSIYKTKKNMSKMLEIMKKDLN